MYLFYHSQQDPKTAPYYKGLLFEELLRNYFEKQGFLVELRRKHGGLEYDIEGQHLVSGIEILGEAKAHARPIRAKDVTSFIGKTLIRRKETKNERLQALFLSTTPLVAEAQEAAEVVQSIGIVAHSGHELFLAISKSLSLPGRSYLGRLLSRQALQLKDRWILTTDMGIFTCVSAADSYTTRPIFFGIFSIDGTQINDSEFLGKLRSTITELGELRPLPAPTEGNHLPPGCNEPGEAAVRQVKEHCASFASLKNYPTRNFSYFSMALEEISGIIFELIESVQHRIESYSAGELSTLLDNLNYLINIPAILEEDIQLTSRIAKGKSKPSRIHEMLQIFLLEYSELFSARLTETVYLVTRNLEGGSFVNTRRGKDYLTSIKEATHGSEAKQFQGMLNLLRLHREVLIQDIKKGDYIGSDDITFPVPAVVKKALWGNFDIVLIEEQKFGLDTSELMGTLLNLGFLSRKFMAVLSADIRRFSSQDTAWLEAIKHLEESGFKSSDLDIATRSFTVLDSASPLWRPAVENLERQSIWRLLAISRYPLVSKCEVAHHLLSTRNDPNIHRITFDLLYSDIAGYLLRGRSMRKIEQYALCFQGKSILREEWYHRRLIWILDGLIDSQNFTPLPETGAFREKLGTLKQFSEAKLPQLEMLFRLPQIAYERLFRKPMYFYELIRESSNEAINKAIRQIKKQRVFLPLTLRNSEVSRGLLEEIARTQLLSSDHLKVDWARNPKASASQARLVFKKLTDSTRTKIMNATSTSSAMRQVVSRL